MNISSAIYGRDPNNRFLIQIFTSHFKNPSNKNCKLFYNLSDLKIIRLSW